LPHGNTCDGTTCGLLPDSPHATEARTGAQLVDGVAEGAAPFAEAPPPRPMNGLKIEPLYPRGGRDCGASVAGPRAGHGRGRSYRAGVDQCRKTWPKGQCRAGGHDLRERRAGSRDRLSREARAREVLGRYGMAGRPRTLKSLSTASSSEAGHLRSRIIPVARGGGKLAGRKKLAIDRGDGASIRPESIEHQLSGGSRTGRCRGSACVGTGARWEKKAVRQGWWADLIESRFSRDRSCSPTGGRLP